MDMRKLMNYPVQGQTACVNLSTEWPISLLFAGAVSAVGTSSVSSLAFGRSISTRGFLGSAKTGGQLFVEALRPGQQFFSHFGTTSWVY